MLTEAVLAIESVSYDRTQTNHYSRYSLSRDPSI